MPKQLVVMLAPQSATMLWGSCLGLSHSHTPNSDIRRARAIAVSAWNDGSCYWAGPVTRGALHV